MLPLRRREATTRNVDQMTCKHPNYPTSFTTKLAEMCDCGDLPGRPCPMATSEQKASAEAKALIKATLEMLVTRAEAPLRNDLEVGFRHTPFSKDEQLQRFSEFAREVKVVAEALLEILERV